MKSEKQKSLSKARYERYKHLFKAYYQRNKDKIREKQKAYREQNKEKIKEWQKREKYKPARERWFAEHKKEIRAYQRKYYREVIKPRKEIKLVN